MAQIKFITSKGSSSLTTSPFYVGTPQHERTMSVKESYDYLAEQTGYKPTAIRAAFMAFKDFVRENNGVGNITCLDGVASIRNTCRGHFASMSGPWTKVKNYIALGAVSLDPFKSALSDIIPTNRTEGANPAISTVLDETTGVYDVITGTDVFSIAGTDLGPDTAKADEYVAFVSKTGVETKCAITLSTLGNVKAKLNSALAAGEYTLCVYTRSGLGDEFGVKCAKRKVEIA